MTIKQVIKHFGNKNKVAKALGINRVSVIQWEQKNYVPPKRQLQIQEMTKGKLKAGL